MKFEIAIEGSHRALSLIRKKLAPFSTTLDQIPSADPAQPSFWRLTFQEEASGLDDTLMQVSRVLRNVERDLGAGTGPEIRVRNMAYSEPTVGSRHFEKPFRPVPSLTVVPWTPSVEEVRDGRTILLDPHRAFGTGQHPSTRLCLQALEHLSGKTHAHRRLRGLRVLDFGCGSGVLALAAARLGARRVLGVEIDPNAVQTAKRNVSLNGLDRTIGIKQGTWDMVKERYHIILANLVPAALLRSIPHLPTHMEATGQAVVSGFGENQMEEVLGRCKGEGLISEHTWTLEGWVAVMLKKRPSSHA